MAKLHFIGIGGIGMSALARLAKAHNHEVSGSDSNQSKLTEQLIKEDIQVYYEHKEENIKNADEVIFSTAISHKNPEMVLAKSQGILKHRSECLSDFFNAQKGIAVAGTHGKTSTSTILSSLLVDLGQDPNCIIGGISKKFKSNARLGKGELFVAEADESDRSFLSLSPYCSIITNLEIDHVDQYGSLQEMIDVYSEFVDKTLANGFVVFCGDDNNLSNLMSEKKCRKFSYGRSEGCDLRLLDIKDDGINTIINSTYKNKTYTFAMPGFGEHNVLNALACVSFLLEENNQVDEINMALSKYEGVARRMDLLLNDETENIIIYDDYAHHPTEVSAGLSSIKARYSEHKTICIFQPHRYSRTKEFLEDFSKSLSLSDETFVLPIYPAGEDPISGIDSEKIVSMMSNTAKTIESVKEIRLENNCVYIAMGAGSISAMMRELIDG